MSLPKSSSTIKSLFTEICYGQYRFNTLLYRLKGTSKIVFWPDVGVVGVFLMSALESSGLQAGWRHPR
jgi:hypothetical protein